ncbi:MAG TPA: hypothetical protein VFI54_04100 [Solirubrobacteraceae bacterium]|nr:hypothetical protein [Solirubrobacteraceae bacterium]
MRSTNSEPGIDLFWLPLGAGGHFVRLNGRAYEALAARVTRRPVQNLYHSALQVRLPEGRFVIEQAPVRASDGHERGVVAQGPVGARWAGRLRIFRYEVRCWRDGFIPDLAEAVESPQRLSDDVEHARQLIAAAPSMPTPVWGRDERRDVELELDHRLANRPHRLRRGGDPAAGGWTRPGVACGHRCRASTAASGAWHVRDELGVGPAARRTRGKEPS